MRRFILLSIVAIVAIGLVAWAQEPGADEQAIRALADKYVEIWNRGTVQDLTQLYTPDADWVGTDGQEVKGRDAIIENYVEMTSAFKGSQLSIQVTSIRLIHPNVAVGDNSWELAGGEVAEGQPPPTKGMATVVVVKQEGAWLIAAHRLRVPTPPPGAGPK